MEQHFIDNVPTDSIEAVIQQKLQSYGTRQFNVRTTLPENIGSLGWQDVNLYAFPAGFTHKTKALETDLACIKHTAEEVGMDPSIAKLNAYFAEMVAACLNTFVEWKDLGCPANYTYSINKAVGYWTIKCKKIKPNHCEIYHIDSGYANSGWTE